MDRIAARGGPIRRGTGCLRRWPRLQHVLAVMMVTMPRVLSDGVARKAHRQTDRDDKAFDHGSMFPIEIERADRQFSNRTAQICDHRGETRETLPPCLFRGRSPAAPENMAPSCDFTRIEYSAGEDSGHDCWLPVVGKSHRGIIASRSASLTFS